MKGKRNSNQPQRHAATAGEAVFLLVPTLIPKPMKQSKTLLRVIFLAALGLAAPVARGSITWTNTAGGNWSAAANWSPNQVPGSSDRKSVV